VKTEYTTIHIPKVLAELIDKLIKNGEFAYSSRSDLLKMRLEGFWNNMGIIRQIHN
jgi:Arc/MetJ-type ribon-helix-helix transcriptional regulator